MGEQSYARFSVGTGWKYSVTCDRVEGQCESARERELEWMVGMGTQCEVRQSEWPR